MYILGDKRLSLLWLTYLSSLLLSFWQSSWDDYEKQQEDKDDAQNAVKYKDRKTYVFADFIELLNKSHRLPS